MNEWTLPTHAILVQRWNVFLTAVSNEVGNQLQTIVAFAFIRLDMFYQENTQQKRHSLHAMHSNISFYLNANLFACHFFIVISFISILWLHNSIQLQKKIINTQKQTETPKINFDEKKVSLLSAVAIRRAVSSDFQSIHLNSSNRPTATYTMRKNVC